MLDKWEITIPKLTGKEKRYAYCYVPDTAQEDDRFPVLYMFDGHNLFSDEEATYGKSWGMLEFLEENEFPLIVAAIECNHHPETDKCGGRLSEYSPFDFKNRWWGEIKGRGKITMDYFVDRFKPYIDKNYPTLPEREYTFIAGSSMGGLMSIYALVAYNDVFSGAAALSPCLWVSMKRMKQMVEEKPLLAPTRIYMDLGTAEIDGKRKALADMFKTAQWLSLAEADVTASAIPGAVHSEAAWEKRIPIFFDYLLQEERKGNP